MSRVFFVTASLIAVVALMAGTGCQSGSTASAQQTAATERSMASEKTLGTEISELDRLVASVQSHPRRPFRMPVQVERARTMQLVAEKTEIIMARMSTSGPESALTGSQHRDSKTMASMQTSLRGLQQAARANNASAMADNMVKIKAEYGQMDRP